MAPLNEVNAARAAAVEKVLNELHLQLYAALVHDLQERSAAKFTGRVAFI